MEHVAISKTVESKATTEAFVWSRVFNIPFWVMLNTLSIILYKEFHVSPFLITCLIAVKPATALLATYWSCFASKHEKFLVLNLIVTNLLRFIPFLFFFWINTPWLMVVAFCIYMTLSRGSMPAWMEIFKRNISDQSQTKVFAFGSTIEYLGSTIFPLFIGIALDIDHRCWRVLFPLTAALGLISTVFLWRIPHLKTVSRAAEMPNMRSSLFFPWKRSLKLLIERPDFRRYQLGFMFGGAAMMIVQPILPFFFVDVLNLSYTEMILAITVCKGIGFSLTSPFWVSLFKKINIYRFSALVVFFAALFPLFLLGAQVWGLTLVIVAYLIYGFMQAGSELSWHLSAVTFSKEKNSLPFSETNILTVGIRGCIIPFLGNLIFLCGSSIAVLIISMLLCLVGAFFLNNYSRFILNGKFCDESAISTNPRL